MTYLISLGLVLLSALFSGLTLGLMGLDVHVLKRKADLGNADAKRIYPVRRRGNLLLTTLLLGNVAVNAALSIFLGSIASGVVAGFMATALIFLFGEIIPQAVISRHAMRFGAMTAPIVQLVIWIAYPICGPIAWILDRLLGHEMPQTYSRKELIRVIEEHEDSKRSDIDEDEERIVKGALTFSRRVAGSVMTPATVMESVYVSDKLTPSLVKRLKTSGHSRFPVYDKDGSEVIGILYLRELVGRKLTGKIVRSFMDREVHFVDGEAPLDDVLNGFLKTRHHLFVVIDDIGNVIGVITVEDVLEEIVGSEIVDEFDRHKDMRKVAEKKKKQTII